MFIAEWAVVKFLPLKLCVICYREQPIFTSKAHVFHIDPKTKRSWLSASTTAVPVSFFYDSSRQLYRIISVEGTKVRRRSVASLSFGSSSA